MRISEDNEMGYPGQLNIFSYYFLTDNDKLIMEWKAETTSDKKTPVNLTNHTYWNLSGDFAQKSIADHDLHLCCYKVIELDK